MTELLYLADLPAAYERRFQATVVRATDRYVVLDRTLFYPLGGGQEADHGTLSWEGGGARVGEVSKKGEVVHYFETPQAILPTAGTTVQGAIDWDRRFGHMRMHTSQHLVSGQAFDLFGASTVGNQLRLDRSRIDIAPATLSDEDVVALEESVNRALGQRIPIVAREIDRGELEELVDRRRVNLSLLPKAVTRLRIIEIGTLDTCPCAGTHVGNTAEIGRVRMLKKESKGGSTQRLSYTLEAPGSPATPPAAPAPAPPPGPESSA